MSKLSICYLVPGHNLFESAGPTRNVLALATALSKSADVTVAFRRIIDPLETTGFKVIELDPDPRSRKEEVDDAAIRGMRSNDFFRYVARLRDFVKNNVHHYDLFLEKSWILSGYMASLCAKNGTAAAVLENHVRVYDETAAGKKSLSRFRHWMSQKVTGHYLRKAPLIIAETPELKVALNQRWKFGGDKISVVPLGVDHERFKPTERGPARKALGLNEKALILLYVGVLDRIHDLAPALEAFRQASLPETEFHIVGDGELKASYEAAYTGVKNVFFHGRKPHASIPTAIAAADVCLAPYNTRLFPEGKVTYSTLKVVEYMACGRPVAGVPSGHLIELIQDGRTGFLIENDVDGWKRFMQRIPSRDLLESMGVNARNVAASYSWEETASKLLRNCEKLLAVNESPDLRLLAKTEGGKIP